MTQPTDPRKVKVIVELIDHTTKIAEANDRGDLVERLQVAKDRITDPQIRVVVAGHLKQGKSQLLNSLLNMPVARIGDDEATVLATVVHYGEQPSARLIVNNGDGAEPDVIEIPPADLNKDLRRAPQAAVGRCCGLRLPRRARCSRAAWHSSTHPVSADTASRTCRPRWA